MQKKNNWRPESRDYRALPQAEIRLDRRPPGEGFRHLVTVAQLRAFLDLLPEWDEVGVGVTAIVFAEGGDAMGWYDAGVVALCAWERETWWDLADEGWVEEHRAILDFLGVDHSSLTSDEAFERFWRDASKTYRPTHPAGRRFRQVRWTEEQARAFQLLHVLPHELGHHHDRITTRSKREAARGESYAERYATVVLQEVWPAYARRFGA